MHLFMANIKFESPDRCIFVACFSGVKGRPDQVFPQHCMQLNDPDRVRLMLSPIELSPIELSPIDGVPGLFKGLSVPGTHKIFGPLLCCRKLIYGTKDVKTQAVLYYCTMSEAVAQYPARGLALGPLRSWGSMIMLLPVPRLVRR